MAKQTTFAPGLDLATIKETITAAFKFEYFRDTSHRLQKDDQKKMASYEFVTVSEYQDIRSTTNPLTPVFYNKYMITVDADVMSKCSWNLFFDDYKTNGLLGPSFETLEELKTIIERIKTIVSVDRQRKERD